MIHQEHDEERPFASDQASHQFAARDGKYLTFQLGEESYGIEALRVHEIIRMTDVTRVPNTPPFVRGVINLRGKITPVVDMRLKFALEARSDTDRTCIIVVQLGYRSSSDLTMGLVVDEVSEVLDIGAGQIERPPRFGASDGPDFILGMGKVGGSVLILLDIEKVLSQDEVESVGRVTSDARQTDSVAG